MEKEEKRGINDNLSNIKSSYILDKILNNVEKSKKLDLIRYNKNIQNRLKIGLKDYKEYCLIKIELITSPCEYGKFINIKDYDRSYYHFYINDDENETKKNEINRDDKAEKIRIVLDQSIKSLYGLFKDCNCIKKLNFIQFNRKGITNMSNLFSGCYYLEEINLSNLKTNKVTDMSYMFSGCSYLKELDVSNFNTNNVTDMQFMFYRCCSLEKLNVNKFNTKNVINMNGMFQQCSSIKKLDLSNFNTNNLIYI